MIEELDLVWMENLFDIEKIIKLMECCDKSCQNCSKDEKNDCLIEMRESIHSLAIHFKNAIYSFVESCRTPVETEEMERIKPGIYT
ncbi:MAG: hypothetical protein ACFFCS_15085 [Candidatus Hodarchaeota archaeon]